MARAYAIRRRVFIEEQQVPEEIELDADDARKQAFVFGHKTDDPPDVELATAEVFP